MGDWLTSLRTRLRSTRVLFQIGQYTVVAVLARLLPFLLLPILTRNMTPAEFGKGALFISTCSLLVPLVGLRGDAVIVKLAANAGAASGADSSIAFLVPLVVSLVALAMLGAGAWAGVDARNWLGFSAAWIVLAVVTAVLWNYALFYNAVLQTNNKIKTFALVQMAHAAGTFALTAFLVLGPLPDARGRNVGYAVPTLCIGAVCVWQLTRSFEFRMRPTPTAAANFLAIAFPVLSATFATIAAGTIDRFAVSAHHGLDAVGVYALGVTIGSVMAVVVEAVDLAWVPYVARAATDTAQHRDLFSTAFLIWGGLAVAGAIFALAVPPIIGVVSHGPAYAAATSVAIAAVAAVVCKAGFNLLSALSIYSGKARLSSAYNTVLAFVLPLAIWFSAGFGVTAPQLAIGIVYVVAAMLYLFGMRKMRS